MHNTPVEVQCSSRQSHPSRADCLTGGRHSDESLQLLVVAEDEGLYERREWAAMVTPLTTTCTSEMETEEVDEAEFAVYEIAQNSTASLTARSVLKDKDQQV